MPETGGDSNHVAAALRVKYTPTYPETPPVLNVRKVKGLDDDQVAELETLVRSEAENEELLGAAMVYMLAEKVQEWLLDRNEPELDMHAEISASVGWYAGGGGGAGAGSAASSSITTSELRLRALATDIGRSDVSVKAFATPSSASERSRARIILPTEA